MRTPTARIVIVGSEILLGQTLDTNSRTLALRLRNLGLSVARIEVVGDERSEIARALRRSVHGADLVIVAGGIGPTVDDLTREAVADAFDRPLEFHAALWDQIEARFRLMGRDPRPNARRQAFLPAGATAIENLVGTAPCFVVDDGGVLLAVLPGVPSELKHVFDNALVARIHARFELPAALEVRVVRTAGVGESVVDDRLGDLVSGANPAVGLLAHPGCVDVRISARAGDSEEAKELVGAAEETIRERLGDCVYGADEDTLAGVVAAKLRTLGLQLVGVEAGLHGELVGALAAAGEPFVRGEAVSRFLDAQELAIELAALGARHGAEAGAGAGVDGSCDRLRIEVCARLGARSEAHRVGHVGTHSSAAERAANLALDLLRRM